ncbi:hypothetical protein [Paenibacillus flagellatus]|uniref:Uncharacterized protein n=1 Tax=Paenibacillus flagellatus TaxID=2211139 RepID=A0A2V5KA40_9BACL|nr:hypothetical protein [Paenibacillus flagellatus]PYI55762.1 hypothetical protein DLM86_08565 [Paenibacillus flagellatus]
MGRVYLDGLRMTIQSKSYVDAMHAVLTHKGWTDRSKPMLAGMTAAAFRLSVNRRLTAESPTAYNWMAEHFLAGDFIGVASSQQAGFSFAPTFPLYARQSIESIRASIDRGTGAIFWKDDFVVAVGYRDDIGALLYSDGTEDEPLELPYEAFGINDSPYWYVQTFDDRMDADEWTIYKESLIQAAAKWEWHDPLLPERDYACGEAAYEAMARAFESGDFDRDGARQIVGRLAAARRDIADYTAELHRRWPACGAIATRYAEAADVLEEMNGLAARLPAGSGEAARLASMAEEVRGIEASAVREIRSLLRETIGNRFHDIGLR